MKAPHPNTFYRLPVLCAMAVAFVLSLPAQTGSDTRQSLATARMEELKERLKLTPEQVERVRPVLEREAQQMRDILRNFDRNSASMREKRKTARQVKSIRDNIDKQLKGILSPTQMDELNRIREERTNQMRSRGRGDA